MKDIMINEFLNQMDNEFVNDLIPLITVTKQEIAYVF